MSILSRLVADMQLMFRRPLRMQYAALCHRRRKGDGALEILLITSRDTGRWVIPKGWPMDGRSASQVAEQEAFEEAGVKGKAEEEMLGTFVYEKGLEHGVKVPCIVAVHALEVSDMVSKFKEKGKRRLEWVTPEEAAMRVDEPELKALIRSFAAGGPLTPSHDTPTRKVG
ncbi:8-oxo-dGTP pyrophosphatase MutT, NUDIX family [Rhizobium sp. RU20A]|uniref:NUDIX hydrolase n=1 Tax=Rhizobium sp. RU20A TaxID=1907412 RepID=UPI00095431A3|nr:NUDIX hydrolase [Rhizobium sp. RU20A]SIR05958.1 8-oxo-dGTP pyrophosphatase MutT, NUDIX family [Rhizobium sp. RU20A]